MDIDNKVLKTAKEGIYSNLEISRGLDEKLRDKYFTNENDFWHANKKLKDMIKFKQQNILNELDYDYQYDIIFCRNVLIYFDSNTKYAVLSHIKKCMNPNTLLFLGATESLIGIDDSFLSVDKSVPGLYKLR